MGIELEGETLVDATPSLRARVNIEQVFSERYAPEVFAALKSRALAEPPAPCPLPPRPLAGSEAPCRSAAGAASAFIGSARAPDLGDEPISEERCRGAGDAERGDHCRAFTSTGGVAWVQAWLKGRPGARGSAEAVGPKLELSTPRRLYLADQVLAFAPDAYRPLPPTAGCWRQPFCHEAPRCCALNRPC